MDARENPYTPGAGRRPPRLAGRDEDLDLFNLMVARIADGNYERSLIFSGLRGVGKTVLLIELDTIARESGWSTTAVHEVGSQPDFRVTFGRMAAQLLRSMSLKERTKERARRALGVVKAFSAAGPGGLKLTLEVDATAGIADSGDPEEDLAELLVEIGEVARAGDTGTLFLLDEMQNLDAPSLGALSMAFHRISQRDLPVALAGAGLPTLRTMLRDAKPYASRLFRYREIGQLAPPAARIALVSPADQRGLRYDAEAADLVIAESGGYPYFIQEHGRVLWDEVGEPPVTTEHVRAVAPIVSEALAYDFYEPQFNSATDAEQSYLMAMADLGEGPYRSAEVNSRLGHRSRGGSSKERDGLLRKELIWSPRRGLVDLTIPRFDRFLRERYPYGS
jgi:hypothetical protein